MMLPVHAAVKCSTLLWQVTGVEKTRWVETRHSGNNSHDETYKGKHVIFKVGILQAERK